MPETEIQHLLEKWMEILLNLEITVEELTKCFLAAFGEDKAMSYGRCESKKSFEELFDGLNNLG